MNTNRRMSNFDPFAPNVIPSSSQPTSQAQYDPFVPIVTPNESTSQVQQLIEYEIPGQSQDQAQPHFQLGEETRNQAQQQHEGGQTSSERVRSKSLTKYPDNADPLKLNSRRKYRPSRSVDSSGSSRSSGSGYSRTGISPLDDPTFAPAPAIPVDILNGTHGSPGRRSLTFSMPSFDMVKHSGNAMARISLKSLVLKKWKPIFWICYGDSRIVIFRSKSDFEEWATNPNLNTIQREALVKMDVDFKDITAKPGVRGYRVASLHLKDYGGKTGLMHTFKLEEWMYYGPIILGAFASKSRTDVHTFVVILREIMKRYKQNLSGYGPGPSGATGIQYDSDKSQVSAKSAPPINNRGYAESSSPRSHQIQQSRSAEGGKDRTTFGGFY